MLTVFCSVPYRSLPLSTVCLQHPPACQPCLPRCLQRGEARGHYHLLSLLLQPGAHHSDHARYCHRSWRHMALHRDLLQAQARTTCCRPHTQGSINFRRCSAKHIAGSCIANSDDDSQHPVESKCGEGWGMEDLGNGSRERLPEAGLYN